jgi:flagellar basal-body rod protein FlgB
MEPMYLFSLVSLQQEWLSSRQSLVAQNIANANSPGYQTADLVPFSKVLDKSALLMSGQDPSHIRTSLLDVHSVGDRRAETWETSHSGNSVSLENEMIKSGEIRGAFSLGAGVLKAFHSMWLSSLKG